MRLDKLLTEQGFGSKRDIKRLLFSKQIRVNGEVVMQENLNIDPQFQVITVNDEVITTGKDVYYMLHKPKRVISAVIDDKQQTVIDLLKETDYRSDIFPVGRLDADTTGLLLLTNNGRLAYHMLHPKYHVEKVYEVTVNGLLTSDSVKNFKNGVVFLDGTVCQSAVLTILSASSNMSKAHVMIKEGKFHQIKKMFLSVGVKVISLKRIAFGTLTLDETLKEGQYRALTKRELQQLSNYFQ